LKRSFDANHTEIKAACQAIGAEVLIDGAATGLNPDLVFAFRRKTLWMEIKVLDDIPKKDHDRNRWHWLRDPKGHKEGNRHKPGSQKYLAEQLYWQRIYLYVVANPDEAREALLTGPEHLIAYPPNIVRRMGK
jgi:hypothetical protein